MRIPILILISMMLLPIVVAQDSNVNVYKPNERFDLSVHLTDDAGDVTGANCDITIRNNTFGEILFDDMNEIENGWYNYTYNTSRTGTYLCSQNCTKGTDKTSGNCNFIIEGDDKVPLTAMISLILVILVYLWIVSNFTSEKMKDHGLVKTALLALILWVLLLPINFSIESLGLNGASTSMISIMSTMHVVMIYLNVLFSFYLVIFFIVSFLRSLNETKDTNQ